MRKALTAIALAAAFALASVAAPQPAEANDGGAVAAGIIGGLALGAIIGSAASGPHYYDYDRGYYYRPRRYYYYRPRRYYYRSHCWWGHDRYWNGWRWRWHRVRVCD